MRFQSVPAACVLAALVCCGAAAQSTAPATSSSQQNSQQTPQGGLEPGAAPLQLQNLAPVEHTLTPEEQAQVQREQAYQTALRIARLTARWGPAMSTPGVSIALAETGRTKTASGATEVTYRITGSGFRAGETLNLVRWPLGEGVNTEMGGLVLNAQGIAVCSASTPAPAAQTEPSAPGTQPPTAAPKNSAPAPPRCTVTMRAGQPVEIQAIAAPGEPVRVALIGEDRSNGAAAQAIPFPIADTDKSCSLQVLLGMKDADMVVLEGAGFPANATLKIETSTSAQTRTLNAKTNSSGHMAMVIMPAVAGQTTGVTSVRFTGLVTPAAPSSSAGTAPQAAAAPAPTASGPGCAPALSFHWGPGSYKPD